MPGAYIGVAAGGWGRTIEVSGYSLSMVKWFMGNYVIKTGYLLLRYMIGNDGCKVILGSSFAEHKLPNELRAFMHNYYPGGGGSLWFSHKSLR